METLAFGYGLAEAPRADQHGNVHFSDVLGGGVYRWSSEAGVETVIPKRRGVGGLVPHRDGGLVVSGRDVSHVTEDGSRTVLTVEGATGFNDLTTTPDGDVLVGALRFNPFQGDEPVPGEIWLIEPGGASRIVMEGVLWPNGIGVSPDAETFYVCDYQAGEVRAAPLSGGEAAVFAKPPRGSADGLAVDALGGVWVALAAGGGIAHFDSEGALQGILDVPASFVTSLCFGGANRRELFITTMTNDEDPDRAGTLFRTRSEVAGLAVAPAAV